MFECNNVLNLEKSKTSTATDLKKLMVTYLHMYKWNYVLSDPLSKKKCENSEDLLYLPTHTFLCPTYVVYEDLLNLSTPCLRHRRLRPLPCVSPLAFSSASLCLFFLPSPAFPASPIFVSWLLCGACCIFLWFPTFLPLARDHPLELGDATTELVCAFVLTRCGSCNLFV